MVQEKIIEVESIVNVIGRGYILCVRIPVEDGFPVILSNLTNLRTKREHKVCFVEGSMTLMTIPRRKEGLGIGVTYGEEFKAGDKIKLLLKKK